MIQTTRHGDVGIITLARAEKRNALTPDMLRQLGTLAASLGNGGAGVTGENIRAVLLRGEGPVFCSGFDLDACRDSPGGAVMRRFLEDLSFVVARLRSGPVPVVVAAQGGAIAGGCALLGGADVVITDRGAKLGYPVVRLGVSPAVSAPFLRRSVADGVCRALMLDPGLISGVEATRIGLAHECMESAERVQERALEVAAELAAKPPEAVRRTRGWLLEIEEREQERLDPAGSSVGRALACSLALAGGREERQRLAKLWR